MSLLTTLAHPRRPLSDYLLLPSNGSIQNYISTPHKAAFAVTDLDVWVDLALDDWTPSSSQTIMSQFGSSTPNFGWRVLVLSDGRIQLVWSTTGSNVATAQIANPAWVDGSRHIVHVNLDVDDGAGHYVFKVYDSTDTSSQIGATTTIASTTSIYNGGANPLMFGGRAGNPSSENVKGKIYQAALRAGLGGADVASPDFRKQVQGRGSISDAQGNLWTPGTAAEYAAA